MAVHTFDRSRLRGTRLPAQEKCSERTGLVQAYRVQFGEEVLVFGGGVAGFGPAAPAAVHREDVRVAHLLEVVGGER